MRVIYNAQIIHFMGQTTFAEVTGRLTEINAFWTSPFVKWEKREFIFIWIILEAVVRLHSLSHDSTQIKPLQNESGVWSGSPLVPLSPPLSLRHGHFVTVVTAMAMATVVTGDSDSGDHS
jgi:hypothetical protein